MSANIDTRIVEMQFENGKFEREIAKTIASLGKLDNSLSLNNLTRSAGAIASVFNSIKLTGLENTLGSIGESLQRSESKIWQWFSSLEAKALQAAENIAKSFTIQPAVEGWEEYNTKTKSTQTLLNNVSKYGSTMDDVSKVLDELNTYADKTTYSFAGMIQTMSGASASGLKLDELKDYTIGLSNLAAYSGVDNTQLQRAGYQINQALTKGFFQVQDWRSIENANLATTGFMETLQDVAREGGIDIDSLIATDGSFRDTLNRGWLTKDIFLEALNRYGDSTTELGQKAFESATKTKTFSESMDQIKESLGSGWGKSFELIVGNMEQAKEFWTTITTEVLKFTDSLSNSRNEMLKSWRELGGADKLLKAIKNSIIALRNILQQLGEGWNSVFPEMTGERLLEITEYILDLTVKFKKFTATTVYFRKIGAGIASLLQGALKVLEGLGVMISPIVGWIKAGAIELAKLLVQWSEWQKSAGDVKNWGKEYIAFAERVRDAIASIPDKIKWVINQFKKFYLTLNKMLAMRGINLVRIFDKIKNGVIGMFSAIWGFISGPFKKDGENTVGIFAMLQDIFSDGNMLSGAAKLSDIIANIFNFFTGIKDWWDGSDIKAFFVGVGNWIGDAFSTLWSKIFPNKDGKEGPALSLANLFNAIKEPITNLWNWAVEVLQPVIDIVMPALEKVKEGISVFFEGLKNAYLGASGSTKADTLVNGGILAAVIYALTQVAKFAKTLDKVTNNSVLKNLLGTDLGEQYEKFFGYFDKFFNSYDATQKEARATLRNKSFEIIANSILKLVGAMFILSLIDTDKMGSGLLIITGFIADLMYSMKFLSDTEGLSDEAKILGISKTMGRLATAVLEIVFALKIIDTAKDIRTSALTLMLIMGEFVAAIMVLSALETDDVANLVAVIPVFKKLSMAMVKLAAAFRIIATVSPAKDSNTYAMALIGLMAALTAMTIGLGKTITKDQAATLALLPPILKQLAISVLMLSASVALLSLLDAEAMGRGVLAVVVLMGVMLTLVESLAKVKSGLSSITEMGGMILLLAISMIAVSGAVMMLASLPTEPMFKAVLAIVILMGTMSLVSKTVAESESGAMMLAAGAGMLLMGIALIEIAKCLQMIAAIDFMKMSATVSVFAGIMGIMALMILLTSAVPPAGLIVLGAAMIVLSVGLAGVVAIMQVLAQMDPGKMAQAIIGFAAIMLAIGAVMALVGTFGAVVLVGAGAFALFAISVLALAAAFALLATSLLALAAGGTAALPILGALLSGIIAGAIAGFVQGMVLLLQGLQLLLPEILKTLDTILYSIRDWLFSKITFMVENMIKYTIAILDGIIPNIAEIIAKLFILIKEILKGVSEGLDKNGDEIAIYIADIVAKLIDMIIKALIELFTRLFDIGYNLGTQIGDGLVKAWPWIKDNIIKPIEDAWNGIKDWFVKFRQSGIDLITNIVNGIKGFPDTIKNTISGFIDNAVNWIRNFDFMQVGRDIIGGLLKGIGLNADDFYDAAGNLASGAIDTFKSIFGIHSPSKVMEEDIAKNGIIAGLVKGIQDGMNSASKAAESTSSGLMDTFSKYLNFDNITNGLGDDLSPTITPVLDLSNVEDGLGDLDSMMPNTTIDMASITGTGFNTKMDIKNAQDLANEERMNELLSSLDKRDSSFAEALMKNDNKDIKVYLDKDILVGSMYRDIDSKLGKETVIQRRQ